MPNGTRRGGSYTRNGRTYYRRSASIRHGASVSPRQSYRRWGLGGTDLAGLGVFLTACEVTLRVGWMGCTWAYRGLSWMWEGERQRIERDHLGRGKRRPAADRPPSPLTFTLEEDQPNGWRKGDVQCKIHHSRRVQNCKGCVQAGREQRATQVSQQPPPAKRVRHVQVEDNRGDLWETLRARGWEP